MRYVGVAVALALLAPLPAGAGESFRPGARTGEQAARDQAEPVRVHPEAREAIDRLKSPFCPGFMLEVCPSPQAEALRDSLNALAHQGVESDSLVARVLAAYGEEWRAVPEARGGGLLAWLVPPAVLLLGVLVVVVALRRLVGPRDEDPGEAVELSEQDERRLREAMEELEAAEEPLF